MCWRFGVTGRLVIAWNGDGIYIYIYIYMGEGGEREGGGVVLCC